MRSAFVVLALCVSCVPVDEPGEGEGEGEGLPPMPALPDVLRVQGSASGTVGEETVTCTFFADLAELVPPADGSLGFDATILGGEVFRRVEPADGEGTGAEFQALIGGPATLRRTASGDELRIAGDQAEGPRFWRALEVLVTEHAVDAAEWEGSWSCEPLDINEPGFVDTTTIVEGDWSMAAPE